MALPITYGSPCPKIKLRDHEVQSPRGEGPAQCSISMASQCPKNHFRKSKSSFSSLEYSNVIQGPLGIHISAPMGIKSIAKMTLCIMQSSKPLNNVEKRAEMFSKYQERMEGPKHRYMKAFELIKSSVLFK